MQPITLYEREKIEVYLRMKKKKKWIADKLKRDYSVIKREIKRNSGEYLPYKATDAQYFAERRKRNTNKRKLDKPRNKLLKEYVEKSILNDWSPQQIAGRLKEKPPDNLKEVISHESIYQYIYSGAEKHKHLYEHLRTARKQRQKRFSRKKQGNKLKNRISIHLRPLEIDQRKEYGHWETDLVEFGREQKKVLSVKYERKSMLCRLHKIKNKTALENEESIIDVVESFPCYWFKSVTRDNGGENAKHLDTLNGFDVPSYFCDPYCSWQKGGIENLNKLIRQYLPKKMNFAEVKENDILKIQEILNNRPRKSLNYLTPNEIFANNS
jgi:transposase, IS30 family